MPKRRKGGHEAGLEMESGGMMRWLLTYADLITLLLATFVILYAVSATQSKITVEEIKAAIKAVFGPIEGNTAILPSQSSNAGENYKIIPGEPREGGPVGGPNKPKFNPLGDQEKGLVHALQPQLGANKVYIRKEARGLVISLLTDKVLFDIGDYHLKPEGREMLDKIVPFLKKDASKKIAVEGYTDDLSVHTGKLPSNWELSALRATAVVRYLVSEKGLDPSRFSAAGYGEYQPLVPNISEANRRLNRRVDIVIMNLD